MGDKNDDEEHEKGAYKDDPSLAKLTVTGTVTGTVTAEDAMLDRFTGRGFSSSLCSMSVENFRF